MRSVILAVFSVVLIGGCAQTPMMDMEKPEPPAELSKLQRMIGTWAGTVEIVSPMPNEAAVVPASAGASETAEPIPTSYKSGGTSEWVNDGMFLMSRGWHEMPGDERQNYVEYITWDAKKQVYRSWYFSDWGEFGEGTMTMSPDGNTLSVKASGRRANGESMRGKGSMTFIDDDTIQWSWSEGAMKMEGTNKRQR